MSFAKSLVLILIIVFFYGCDGHKKETTYYEDDNEIKSISYYKTGHVKDGPEFFYFPNGTLSAEGNWVNGKKDGLFKEYYNTGNIAAKLNFHNDLLVGETTLYNNNGGISELQYYDSLGKLYDIKKFNSDGTRNKRIIPLPWLAEDTVSFGDTIDFNLRLANLTDMRYLNGTFFRCSNFIHSNDKLLMTDTLDIVRSKENYYSLRLYSDKLGEQFLRGLLVISFGKDSSHVYPVERPYFVK